MLPVIEIPSVVKNHEKMFGFSGQIRKHFKEYLTGLIVSENFTVSGINSMFPDANDQSAMNRFLTEYSWDEEKVNNTRLEFLQSHNETSHKKHGVIVIDDTIIHKTGKSIEGVGWIFDHCENRSVLGQSVVTSHYIDNTVNYPIDYKFYFSKKSDYAKQEEFKSKIQLAIELINNAIKNGFEGGFVMDSWFICNEVVKEVDKHERFIIGRIKSDRLVHTRIGLISISEFAETLPKESWKEIEINNTKYKIFTKVMKFQSLEKKVRVVISHMQGVKDPVFFITNQLGWDVKKIIGTYSMRFKIDNFYKDAKQNFGLEACQLRSLKGIKRHWYMVFLAYSLVKLSSCKSNLSKKLNAVSIGEGCRQTSKEILSSLINWVYKNFHDGVGLSEVIKVLTR